MDAGKKEDLQVPPYKMKDEINSVVALVALDKKKNKML